MDLPEVQDKVRGLMPGLLAELEALVGIPSVAFPGFPPEPVHRMSRATVELFRDSGASDSRLVDVPGGYPAVYAHIPGPPGSPTVLLYAHYDVQPAPPEQGWASDPWTATRKDDGRIYGRGAADDKSGLVIHAGTLRAFDGEPPVGIKILIEGEEETLSHLEQFVEDNPALVAADAFLIADMGNPAVGEPALTSALRGEVSCTVTVRTLEFPVHSGVFGGLAPDALMALIRMLATLLDDAGDTAVAGVDSFEWDGAGVDEAAYRGNAGMLDGTDLIGTGSASSRLWSRPSVSVIGIDAPSVETASNVLIPEASARISMRIAPGSDAPRQLDLLAKHLHEVAPWHVQVEVEKIKAGWPVVVPVDGPIVQAARAALAEAFGAPCDFIGSGASIPLIASLMSAAPDAEIVLLGAEDTALSRIHASDESVDPSEIERLIVAQVRMIQAIAAG